MEELLLAALLIRDRERVSTEDLLVDESGAADPKFPVIAWISSLMEVFRLDGSNEHVEKLWSPFILTDSRVHIEVAGL